MKIVFLHGWHSVPGGVKPTYLKDHGHEVINPALNDDDFSAAVATAQAAYDQHHPEVVVGSSRGGAVALNIDSKDTPLVLLCPAWTLSQSLKVMPGDPWASSNFPSKTMTTFVQASFPSGLLPALTIGA